MQNKEEELDHVLRQLDPDGLCDVREYAHVLKNYQRVSLPAPSAEDWIKLPRWVKWEIAIKVTCWTWQSQLAAWWLKTMLNVYPTRGG